MGFKRDTLQNKELLLRDELETDKREEKYRLIVENANEAIVVVQDGVLKFFNQKTEEFSGYTRDELQGKPFLDLIHPDDREMVQKRHLNQLKGLSEKDLDSFRVIDKAGSIKWVEIKPIRIKWDGRPAILNFISDVTKRKREEKLRTALYKIATITSVAEDLQDFYASIHRIVGNLMYCLLYTSPSPRD